MKVKVAIVLAPNSSFNTSPTTSPNVCNLSRSSRLLDIPANLGTLNAICNRSCRVIQDSPLHLPLYQNIWNIEAMCNRIWRMIIHENNHCSRPTWDIELQQSAHSHNWFHKEIACDFLNVSGEVVCCVTRRPKLYSFRLWSTLSRTSKQKGQSHSSCSITSTGQQQHATIDSQFSYPLPSATPFSKTPKNRPRSLRPWYRYDSLSQCQTPTPGDVQILKCWANRWPGYMALENSA